jgi:hypothetical protein
MTFRCAHTCVLCNVLSDDGLKRWPKHVACIHTKMNCYARWKKIGIFQKFKTLVTNCGLVIFTISFLTHVARTRYNTGLQGPVVLNHCEKLRQISVAVVRKSNRPDGCQSI